MAEQTKFLSSLGRDLPASIVVALVALPLCLGIALASGAPLFSGLIAGIVGGILVGALSKSQLSVSGPAAGLTVIVLDALEVLPSWEVFLLAVMLSGLLQVALYFTRSGTLSEFVPSSVITGMLAAIGLILILKQIPHALGYDGDFEGSLSFLQPDGLNTLSALFYSVWDFFLPGPIIVALISLVFLFWWDASKPKEGPLRLLPGPLVVVIFGVLANEAFKLIAPGLVIDPSHLVQVPVSGSLGEFVGQFRTPDFSAIGMADVWIVAATLAIVASLESLLCVKAVDEIDPQRRTTDKNHELLAQGGGNFLSGLIGGLPLTSVIVRSSANVAAGAETKASAVLHGFWLLLSVLLIPFVLNLIPLAALAAILIQVGYKLNTPELYKRRWAQGWHQFVPFIATIAAILFTDLLRGIIIGLVIGFVFVVARNFRTAVSVAHDDDFWMVSARRNLYFIHKYELQNSLGRVPEGATVVIDLERAEFVDPDNIDIINSFSRNAHFRDISVSIRGDVDNLADVQLEAPSKKVAYS
ncbi:SulP family inorganic anion transporter [Erythrobacter litoralis]|uniref:SulP family inorganic anion transporter n=1 Tax=Erythrobacter litoralis TaxID=39960 RepID=UPI0024348250|nr:SulP family inorganic anion transporter [Erythrobacter litoralis]MDG6079290.1 SulP family inorganic anion transporter [Erythrobacter litoralis]